MKIRLLMVCGCFLFVMANCNKSKYQTKPQITIQSINTQIPFNGSMQANLHFTQKDGKLSQGIFISIRNRVNQTPLPPGTGSADTVVGVIPQFPDLDQGDFQFTLDYISLHESDVENDTFVFKFAVIDRVGNKSDTISSPKVVVERQ
jgi:hypothetical protein